MTDRAFPFSIGESLPREPFRAVRLRTIFECCKYDPQVEDSSVLAPFPVFMPRPVWAELAELAEGLTRETLHAEQEILSRVELLKQLATPRSIWKLLSTGAPSCSGPRVMRFDFHFTLEGWRISEVNSDVPGGFIEADGFTQLMSEACGGLPPAGLPGRELARALIQRAGVERPTIAFVHATAYSDDRQVNMFLAREVGKLGGTALLIDPSQVSWQQGNQPGAHIKTEWFNGEAHLIYRFFPAEWLPNLRGTCAWPFYFTGARTPQTNPAWALISQSKRFGIILRKLRTPTPFWDRLLPETRDLREVDYRSSEWVLKPALGRVGEGIGLHGTTAARTWRQIRRSAFFFPGHWVAQRRFELLPMRTPAGSRYFCFGVYTIDGRAAGVYARASKTAIVNQTAQDVAVLLPADK